MLSIMHRDKLRNDVLILMAKLWIFFWWIENNLSFSRNSTKWWFVLGIYNSLYPLMKTVDLIVQCSWMKNSYWRVLIKLRFYKSFHCHTTLIKWHIIRKLTDYINFFAYFVTNMLVKSKVRINLSSKQFFSWT